MRKALHEVLETVGRHHRDDPLFKVAVELERVALSDVYFVEKRLSPNLDFYSALTLKARSGSPRRCSPCCTRSPARRAGLRIGRR